MIQNYFNNSFKLVKINDLSKHFNVSNSYYYIILKQLIIEKKIVKLTDSKIKYWKSIEK